MLAGVMIIEEIIIVKFICDLAIKTSRYWTSKWSSSFRQFIYNVIFQMFFQQMILKRVNVILSIFEIWRLELTKWTHFVIKTVGGGMIILVISFSSRVFIIMIYLDVFFEIPSVWKWFATKFTVVIFEAFMNYAYVFI